MSKGNPEQWTHSYDETHNLAGNSSATKTKTGEKEKRALGGRQDKPRSLLGVRTCGCIIYFVGLGP